MSAASLSQILQDPELNGFLGSPREDYVRTQPVELDSLGSIESLRATPPPTPAVFEDVEDVGDARVPPQMPEVQWNVGQYFDGLDQERPQGPVPPPHKATPVHMRRPAPHPVSSKPAKVQGIPRHLVEKVLLHRSEDVDDIPFTKVDRLPQRLPIRTNLTRRTVFDMRERVDKKLADSWVKVLDQMADRVVDSEGAQHLIYANFYGQVEKEAMMQLPKDFSGHVRKAAKTALEVMNTWIEDIEID
ncbi:hypothetical protein L596_004799 [Steinernema carpocapsae]|uniref:Uncharacterized protein n=1 Tax=Steinernema carpocapsae TaxID=34508 RepID=A0A4U8UYF4_STECR|nr:hypothetical protein L596_004799 [Steinernema carpocapsae]